MLRVDAGGAVDALPELDAGALPAAVAALEAAESPHWVWADARRWYPGLLGAGVRIGRAHDLRLCAAILAGSAAAELARRVHPPAPAWVSAPRGGAERVPAAAALFELDGEAPAERAPDEPATAARVFTEFGRQQAIVRDSAAPGALRLLLAAESVGGLIGVEMESAGLPWDPGLHERVLEEALGPRPAHGGKPERMAELAAEVRTALEQPGVNLDSQADLLRALQRAGIAVATTRRWELREHEHPAIEPLIAYKKLSRLLTANGWAWLAEWVQGGRFRPEYVPGGAATGRWATNGGGALQLPKQVRRALVADPGWRLVVADAAQLEPRVLSAIARDPAMAAAGRGRDFYAGLVDRGVVEHRDAAKVAILGALYGATSGESGRLVPRLARAYPRAMAHVDTAAREGERGGVVTTFLGRSSPSPSAGWRALQSAASQPGASAADERRARSSARDWGRFTRNFVVQGSAAEWALCWMGELRKRLMAMDAGAPSARADASGPAFAGVPHLVFFLHDEIIVHSPAELADEVAGHVRESAAEAGRLLFGDFPVEFPLDLAIVESYDQAG
ncbi:bifunctional 3'-5' exonuclease/DNA polymerase [Agromyces archimandritae]|uniref:DNA-directed DNA polymerase n=1 Tax=Agromyces archimandritae TaxID=2781962 RepID=A0A975FQQ1_9MICO|nr:bifunctional 3'-5' exonuclease/DNA polymerase [Agromyces archimandritae]QTX06077.1 bifunctional 3'-5' exonuclease/DNA polymerase [Agromyces archimandritae]